MNPYPQRIVCLSAESADWLWRIGAWDQVVGTSSYFPSPPEAPLKPRVSGFASGNLTQIEKLSPDLVITFSDVQSQLAGELIRRGFPVFATNQRTLAEIESTLLTLARLTGHESAGTKLFQEFQTGLAPVRSAGKRPRVYFEEWNEPFVSGIAWVSELIERAGGDDVFARFRNGRAAQERTVSSEDVRAADPEIIFVSWCGRPANLEAIKSRPGWDQIKAVQNNRIYEIPADDILQPGFRLTFGFEHLKTHLAGPEKTAPKPLLSRKHT